MRARWYALAVGGLVVLDVALFGAPILLAPTIPPECGADPCPGIADDLEPVLGWAFEISFGVTLVALVVSVVAVMRARRYPLALGGLLVLDVLLFGAAFIVGLASVSECDADGPCPGIADELAAVLNWALFTSLGATVIATVATIAATVSTIRAKRS